MWRHGGRGWEWTDLWQGHAGFTRPSLLPGKAWGILDGPLCRACPPHLLWPCVPHLSSCRALEPSKMRTSSSLHGFSISPRPDTQEPALLLSFLHPHILSSPSQTSHFLSCLIAKFRLPSSLCFMPTKLLVGQPPVL